MKTASSNGSIPAPDSSTHGLAPPGAGVPAIERFAGRMLVAVRRWRRSPEATSADFMREQTAIARLYGPLDEAARTRAVLIPRLRGLEDSSRCWSVRMTLDHLLIVNTAIEDGIKQLLAGRTPDTAASTAAVKPRADAGPETEAAHEAACERLMTTVNAAGNLRTRARYAHPWFGPLDAAGWHAMAAMHMSIHRRQLISIISGQRVQSR